MVRIVFFALAVLLCTSAWGQGFDLGSIMSESQKKAAEKQSGQLNDAIIEANEVTGSNITPPEEATGFMRLFFTATPSPSVTPTPSVTPSPSITPTSSPTPSASATTTPSPSNTMAPTPSKSPSPTPFADGSSRIINGEQQILVQTLVSEGEVTETDPDGPDALIEVPVTSNEIQDGDIATVEEIEASGEFGTSSARFIVEDSSDDFLLPGLQRQYLGSCGIILFIGAGTYPVRPNSCSLQVYPVPLLVTTVVCTRWGCYVRFRCIVACVITGGCSPFARVRINVWRPPGRRGGGGRLASTSPTPSYAP